MIPMSTVWGRTVQVSYDIPVGNVPLFGVTAGQTISRVRFSWGFYGDTPTDTTYIGVAQNAICFGLVTTVGNGTEPVPNARTQSADQAPPTQRWLWWETRVPIPRVVAPGTIIWGDSAPQEPCDAKGQVLATGLGDGETLNLWASWALGYGWDTSNTFLWVAASVLVLGA
jgi:hypothetical protein